MRFTHSILAKILFPVILLTLLLVGVQLTVSTVTFNNFAQESLDDEIHFIAQSVKDTLAAHRIAASDQTRSLAKNSDMVAAVKAGNREKIQEIFAQFESERKCTFFTILDTESKVVFRVSKPEQFGDTLRMRSVDESLKTKKTCIYYETSKNIPLCIRSSTPIFDEEGNMIGVVNGGFRFDTDEWVDGIKERYGVHCTVFLDDERIATTVPGETRGRAIGTKLNNPAIYDKVVKEKKDDIRQVPVVGEMMQVFYSPLYNEGDEKALGIIFAGIPLERHTAVIHQQLWSNLSITVVGLLVFGGILYGVAGVIVAPIRKMTQAAKDLAAGQLDVDLSVRTKDETTVLATAFQALADSLKAKADVAFAIANGDLTVPVPLSSEHDTLGQALKKMVSQVNQALLKINEDVTRVSTGSNEVTAAAQHLADGAQEAAASLEEITASMSEIGGQTKKNAEGATQARDLAKMASTAAGEGKSAMHEMTEAMERITNNSHEIQRVIKVIDDIAFQTNLLALNAAVEAARAGQHGKGFAVVAEEVRNLASRSAKAAQETSELIVKSGHEIERGGQVAGHTAEVLNTIVEQVQQTTDLIAGIAIASNEQAEGVNQVSLGLHQIDSVTQQNTASAEESASAAHEMSSMAADLKKLVAQFKLHA